MTFVPSQKLLDEYNNAILSTIRKNEQEFRTKVLQRIAPSLVREYLHSTECDRDITSIAASFVVAKFAQELFGKLGYKILTQSGTELQLSSLAIIKLAMNEAYIIDKRGHLVG